MEEKEHKQLSLKEKNPVPLKRLLSVLNAIERYEVDKVHTYKYICIDDHSGLEHIKFNAVYAKMELDENTMEIRMWCFDPRKEKADRVIHNAFTLEENS